MNALQKSYRWVADHLTKWLGVIGFGLMQLDPDSIHSAAVTYLDDHFVRTLGKWLFGLVILRGWYTGWKSKQATATLPTPDPKAVAP
jgi:hypothetical protein